MEWTKSQTRLLISFYKQHPCLYDKSQLAFKNRLKRQMAIKEIVKCLRSINIEVTVLDVIRKIRNLTSQMRRAQKLLIKERRKNPEYNSNFWCFDDLSFLLPGNFTFRSDNNLSMNESEDSIQEEEMTFCKNEFLNDDIDDEGIESTLTSNPAISTSSSTNEIIKEKIFINENHNETDKNCDLLDSFGKTIVCEMKLIKNDRILGRLRRKIMTEIYNAQEEDLEQLGEN